MNIKLPIKDNPKISTLFFILSPQNLPLILSYNSVSILSFDEILFIYVPVFKNVLFLSISGKIIIGLNKIISKGKNMSNDDKKVVSLSGARDKDKSEKAENKQVVVCSFCGRPNQQVIKMIKGPGVNICSECIMICIQYFMLEDRVPSSEAQKVLDAFWKRSKE